MVVVTAAQLQDRDGAKLVLERFYMQFWQSFRLKIIWADASYQGQLLAWVAQACAWMLEIVKRPRRSHLFTLLPKRWIVERTFSWVICNRRLAHDYERLPQTSEAFIYVAMIRLMSKRLAYKPSVYSWQVIS